MLTIGDIGAGHILGRYELLIPIASGGMAAVWAARMKGSRGFQKIVAVKLMLNDVVDDGNLEKMFLDEAALASRIKHPNVGEIIDLGEQGELLYHVMEWIDGEPLNTLLREFRNKTGLPHTIAVRIVSQAASGLHAAHELCDDAGKPLGIVHRDVSPQNLMVTYEGSVKVVDFGVAKAATNIQETRVGQMKGKAAYMAPEQARGGRIDRRADIFALGIVLYQLTTGQHPFRGDNDLLTLRRICDDTPPRPPREILADYPPALEEVVLRAIAKDPAARFETMADMIRDLETALPGERAEPSEVAEFVRSVVGARGERRRAEIKEAQRVADERAAMRVREEASSPTPREREASPGLLDFEVPPPDKSHLTTIVTLLIVGVLAATVVGLYLAEASTRSMPPPLTPPPATS